MEEHISKAGLYYRKNIFEAGKQTIIFIHGLSGSSSAWLQYEAHFGSKYNTLAFDLPGHGKSFKFKKFVDYGIPKTVGSIEKLILELGIKEYILVSHSFGTLLALTVLLNDQSKVNKIIFLSPVYGLDQRVSTKIFKVLLDLFFPFYNLIPIISEYGKLLDYTKLKYPTGDWDIKRIYRDILNTNLKVYLFCLKQIYRVNFDREWQNIKIPTLLLHGEFDTLIPVKYFFVLTKKITGAKVVILDRGNHIFILNDIGKVIQEIQKFINP